MDEHTTVKMKILEILNEYRKEKGPFARKNLKEVASYLNIDFDNFMRVYANELYLDKQIQMDSGWCASITSKGISIIDSKNPFYQEYKNAEIKNININSPVSGSMFIQGNNNTVDISNNFFENFKKEINKSDMRPEEKKEWIKKISDFSIHPIVSQIFVNLISGFLKSQIG